MVRRSFPTTARVRAPARRTASGGAGGSGKAWALAPWLAVACLARPALGQTSPPRLTDEGEVSRIAPMFEAGRYADCARELGRLLDPGSERPLAEPRWVELGRVYRAACLLGAGDAGAAEAVIAEALRANPRMAPPDALVFPPPVLDLWARVRDGLRDELRKADEERLERARREAAARVARARALQEKIAELQLLATEEVVVQRNHRWVAAVPFGVGQFQNGQTALGWTFLVTESLLGAAALGALLVNLSTYRQIATGRNLEPDATNAQLRTSYDVLVVTAWSLLGVGAIGVAHAQLTFVPEVRVQRRRALPAHLRQVDEEPPGGGASSFVGLGLRGRF